MIMYVPKQRKDNLMGWCSGTHVFDKMVGFILSAKFVTTNAEKVDLIKTLIEVLESEDWDCQQDSAYFGRKLVKRAFRELHPDWDEEAFE